jgi:uncharacterized OB-fold protein
MPTMAEQEAKINVVNDTEFEQYVNGGTDGFHYCNECGKKRLFSQGYCNECGSPLKQVRN